jgi:hypothetical protein
MRTNPFYDTWLFLLGQTGDHQGSGVGGLLTVLFLALLAASFWIAIRNWRHDQGQRTGTHLGIWLMRVMIGAMWFQGSLWKLPLPVSGAFKFWTEQLGKYAAFDAHKWIVTNIFVPALPVIDPMVYLTESTLAVSFILGFLVRPLGIVGMLFVANIWLGLYQNTDEWPWQYIFLIFVQGFFVLTNAGRSLGLDALLSRQASEGPPRGALARVYRAIA